MTPERAWTLAINAKWGFSGSSDCPYEYDQGDVVAVDYDSLYDLAVVALEAMKLLLEPSDVERGAATAFLDSLGIHIERDADRG